MHREYVTEKLWVGLFSYQPGVGVTNLATTFSSLLSSRQGKKVWYLEIGGQHTIEKLMNKLKGHYVGDRGEFMVDRITFFPNLSVEKAMGLLKDAPGAVVMDFGVMEYEKEKLAALCTKRILVCDFSLWNQDTIVRTMLWKKEDKKKIWSKCACYLGKGQIKWVEKELEETIYPLPEITNPFCVCRQEFKEIMKL